MLHGRAGGTGNSAPAPEFAVRRYGVRGTSRDPHPNVFAGFWVSMLRLVRGEITRHYDKC